MLFSKSWLTLFLKFEMPPASFAYHDPAHSLMPGSNEASSDLDHSLLHARGAHQLNLYWACSSSSLASYSPRSLTQAPHELNYKYWEHHVLFTFVSVAPRSSQYAFWMGKRGCREEEYLKMLSRSQMRNSDDTTHKSKETTTTKTLVLHEMWRSTAGRNLGLGARLPRLKPSRCYLLAIQSWERF